MSNGADQPRSGLSGALSGILAAVAVVLSNLATVLKSLKEVKESGGLDWLSLPEVSRSWWAILVLIAGNALLFWWIFRRIPKEHPTKRIVAASAAGIVVLLIFAFNLFAFPQQLPHIPEAVQKQLVTQLLEVQVRNGENFQGFSDSLSNMNSEDAWSTAQALIAVMTASDDIETLRPRIHGAFHFIESLKDSADGLWVQQVGLSKLTRTDIAAWVALAYLKSISTNEVWESAEIAPAVNRVVEVLDAIARRQDQTGAWGPTATRSVIDDRTYPTLLALWAFSEAKRTRLVKDQIQSRYDGAMNLGIQWLLRNYHNPSGWYPDPAFLGDNCDGLNFQALFVLGRTQHLPGVTDLSRDQTYKNIERNFLNDSAQRQPATHPCRPANKVLEVDGEILFVSFLDYPWALAGAKFLTAEQNLGGNERKQAAEVYGRLISAANSLAKGFPTDAYSFQLSETLTCMFYKWD